VNLQPATLVHMNVNCAVSRGRHQKRLAIMLPYVFALSHNALTLGRKFLVSYSYRSGLKEIVTDSHSYRPGLIGIIIACNS
jgi:hypothetical protein